MDLLLLHNFLKFVSTATIRLKSGDGGQGIIAWRRESKVVFGGPAGGNGGAGGSVYIEADENLNSLFHIRHVRFLKANNGENGRNKSQHGKSAEDLVLKVPTGTNIFDKATGNKLFELVYHGERFLACKGGKGGRGNLSFKSPKMPAPYLYEYGDLGEDKELIFDLEVISNIGFLGKPNAGKSSLLSLISNAKPKVASFPFTTLIPVLGTVEFSGKKLVFADIPGLIEDSSKGAGLGIEFLKHLNRCRVLVHVVDMGVEDVISEIKAIEKEIFNYSEELFNKPRFLVLNKLDSVSFERSQTIISEVSKIVEVNFICISVLEKTNIDLFLKKIFDFYESFNFKTHEKEQEEFMEFFDDPDLFAKVEITKNEGVWEVKHPYLKYWVHKIPRDTEDNIFRLLQKLETVSLTKELEAVGAKYKDIVDLYDWRYEFLANQKQENEN